MAPSAWFSSGPMIHVDGAYRNSCRGYLYTGLSVTSAITGRLLTNDTGTTMLLVIFCARVGEASGGVGVENDLQFGTKLTVEIIDIIRYCTWCSG